MELRPILSAMRRNKVGAILIAVQMAITLAILCNGLFIIEQRVALAKRPTGTDEANIFSITNQWVGNPRGSVRAAADRSRDATLAARRGRCLCDQRLSAHQQRLDRRE
jgi:putative ABC transport system permease protein